jgi:hypothetical protein
MYDFEDDVLNEEGLDPDLTEDGDGDSKKNPLGDDKDEDEDEEEIGGSEEF